jgi:hypothetical protein
MPAVMQRVVARLTLQRGTGRSILGRAKTGVGAGVCVGKVGWSATQADVYCHARASEWRPPLTVGAAYPCHLALLSDEYAPSDDRSDGAAPPSDSAAGGPEHDAAAAAGGSPRALLAFDATPPLLVRVERAVAGAAAVVAACAALASVCAVMRHRRLVAAAGEALI